MKLWLSGAVFAVLALQPPQPPTLLQQALKAQPGVRLLDPAADLREYTREDLEKRGCWPPWLVADLDRDQRPDVVAVVVKPGRQPEFAVIAVHARAPKDIHAVIDFDVDSINGVTKGKAPDTVVPLFCVECDSNLWFRCARRQDRNAIHG